MSLTADRVDVENAARPGAPAAHPEFDRLVRTMWRLRQPDGCPWDREQTHRSITKNMVEEAYEAVEAIEADDREHLIEELGDVLEQVVLHAQIAADEGSFTIDDVVHGLNEKLVRRHPHVFGEHAAAGDGGEVQDIWDEVKAAERAASGEGERPQGLLDRRALPRENRWESEDSDSWSLRRRGRAEDRGGSRSASGFGASSGFARSRQAASSAGAAASGAFGFKPGDAVEHQKFGRGTVLSVTGSNEMDARLRVKFSSAGVKELGLFFAKEKMRRL